MTSEDRITYNEIDDWTGPQYALGMVDEIVLSNSLIHFEMTTDTSGYLLVQGARRYVFVRLTARPATRVERRQILASNQERLRDHLAGLVPRVLGGRTRWILPWHRRPAAAVCGWWRDRRAAGAVFYAAVEEDMHRGGPEVAS